VHSSLTTWLHVVASYTLTPGPCISFGDYHVHSPGLQEFGEAVSSSNENWFGGMGGGSSSSPRSVAALWVTVIGRKPVHTRDL